MHKISTHTAALSTHAKIRTGDILLLLFLATCALLTVPLIHKAPFLKLSHIEEANREVKKAEAQP